MKVLLIGSFAESLINFRGPLIRDLIAAGHSVVAAAPDISDDIRAQLTALGADVAETPLARTGLNPFADLAYGRTLRALMKAKRPDFVLTYTIKPNIWGAFAARSEGIASAAMVTGLGYAFTSTDGWKARLVRRIGTRLYRRATDANRFIVFQNPDDRDDFIAAGCLGDPSKVRMVNGSGVDTEHFAPAPLPAEPVFLMVSRLLGNKGVREYCEAALAVKAERPDTRFLLVGYTDQGPDGVTRGELDRWTQNGLEYLGPKDDVRPSIAAASVYVLPSYREGTPRSVLEAMAMGRPVIVTDAPGCRETTRDGDNGFLVPVRDVPALAERMLHLAKDASLRQTMGARSRAIAVEKYDVTAVNRSLMRQLELIA